MKTVGKMFIFILLLVNATGCCDNRCSVCVQKAEEPINLQYKLEKIKQQAGDKGLK